MADGMPEWVRRYFSEPRMKPYLRAVDGNPLAAMRLYQWNLRVSAALYIPLNCVELAVRNALHDCLVTKYARPDWWTVAPLHPKGKRLVDSARARCRQHEERRAAEEGRTARPVTVNDVVTELSFGFWAQLVVSRYDRVFWVPTLHRAFPHAGRRDALSEDLTAVVRLRNRVMHHEPVYEENLMAEHARIYRVLEALGPDLAKGVRAMDPFPSVLVDKEEPLD